MTKKDMINKIRRDEFLSSYFQTMLWAETDNSDEAGGEPLEDNYDLEDFSSEALKESIADCERFQDRPGVDDAIDGDYDTAGHDFWLTRNGHGAGFWDGDWPEPAASLLTEASEVMGEVWVYVGDNGLIYVS